MHDIDAHIKTRYGLTEEDYWYHKPSGSWILKHDAVVRIAEVEKIGFSMTVVETGPTKALLVVAKRKDEEVFAIGECTPGAEPSAVGKTYPWCLAQKRGEDRAVLRLLFPGGGLYSESEADDFRRDGGERQQAMPPGMPAPPSAAPQKPSAPTAGDDVLMDIVEPEHFDTRALGQQIKFGKHKGRTWTEVASDEAGLNYLKWLISQAYAEHGANVSIWKDGPICALMAYKRRKAEAPSPEWMR